MTDDLREIPNYTFSEAAHCLGVPVDTIRHWLLGNTFQTKKGPKYSNPLVSIAGRDTNLLSFYNLVEAHVLSALRREHRVKIWKVREALDYLQQYYQSPHPLADYWFQTDGLDIFLKVSRDLEIISQKGQFALRGLLEQYLSRVERDPKNIAIRLYPFTSAPPKGITRFIVIDPWVSFGRPSITGSGIPTSIVAERFKAGELIEDLSHDYGRSLEEIQEAVRYELMRKAA